MAFGGTDSGRARNKTNVCIYNWVKPLEQILKPIKYLNFVDFKCFRHLKTWFPLIFKCSPLYRLGKQIKSAVLKKEAKTCFLYFTRGFQTCIPWIWVQHVLCVTPGVTLRLCSEGQATGAASTGATLQRVSHELLCDELYKACSCCWGSSGRVRVRWGDPVDWARARTHFWKILALLSLEKFSSCNDSWVRKATARWK